MRTSSAAKLALFGGLVVAVTMPGAQARRSSASAPQHAAGVTTSPAAPAMQRGLLRQAARVR